MMAELVALRAQVSDLRGLIDGLLHDFGPLIAAFRPANGTGRPDYLQLAGAARAARRARKHGSDDDG